MKRSVAIICLLIVIGGIATLLIGCPPPVVRIRPPEPRVEVYGPATLPRRCLETWLLGTSGRRLGLGTRPLDETSKA